MQQTVDKMQAVGQRPASQPTNPPTIVYRSVSFPFNLNYKHDRVHEQLATSRTDSLYLWVLANVFAKFHKYFSSFYAFKNI